MILALDGSVIGLISLLICFMADRQEVMLILVLGAVAARMALWASITRHARPYSLATEIAFFVICLALGAFNDWNTVVRHGVYDYAVPSDLLPWSSIPSWMLLYWGMILRFMATLSASPWFASAFPSTRGRWKLPTQLALVLATRQAVYRLYEDPLLSWVPFASALSLYLLLFPPNRGEWRFIALLAVGGPLIESFYIQVGHLHAYRLGRLGGVPAWIVLWWVLAGLAWKDLAPRILALLENAIPVAFRRRTA